ncbi:CBS domain-containing protein [Ekhidna sp.]
MNNDQLLIDQFLSSHPEIAIASINELETEEIALLIETLSLDQSMVILSRLLPYKSGKALERITPERAIACMDHLSLSNAEAILRICEKSISTQILNGVQPERAKYLKRALAFDKDLVGAHLEPYVFTLPVNMKIEKALHLIKSSKAVVKPHVFVLDDEKKLVGYLEVNELITNDPNRTIQTVMKKVPRTVFADMNAKDLLENWDHAFIDLPVVKVNREFIGTVSRVSLAEFKSSKATIDNSAIKAGNALGELFTIGLTSLLGSAESNLKP